MANSKSKKRVKELKRRQQRRSAARHSNDSAATIETALQAQQIGDLDRAERLYREVLQTEPDNPDAWHLLGMTLFAANEFDESIVCLQTTIELAPDQASVLTNLGVVYRAAGQLAEAKLVLERALIVAPKSVATLINLGTVCMELRDRANAELHFDRAIAIDPNSKTAAMNLANLWQDLHRCRDAETLYRKLLKRTPRDPVLLNNLGESLRNQGNWEAAVDALQQALAIDADSIEMRLNLGRNLAQLRRFEDAKAQFAQLIQLHPMLAKPYHYLGKLMRGVKESRDAVNFITRAIELNPASPHAWCDLGFATIETGDPVKAESCFRSAIEIDPAFSSAHGALLYLMSSKANVSQTELFAEHKAWGEIHGAVPMLKSKQQWRQDRDRDPNRRLKVGYVSPDFRSHVITKYFRPVLQNHDATQFETFCYAELGTPDETTENLRSISDQWRFTTGLSDEQVARQILADEIDIVIELAGHTGGNRVRALAYRPAPVQVTWLGYPNTTGLDAIDYRITCEIQNPLDEPTYHTEQLFRMPHSSYCIEPATNLPAVSDSPSQTNGHITFGSLHRPDKLSRATLDLWAGVLHAIPTAQFIAFNTRFTDQSMAVLIKGLSERGIDSDRVHVEREVLGEHYLQVYEKIDIALDVTPWAGGTTTIEALSMGVPVIGFCGNRRSSRSTAAMLSSIGEPSLVADSIEQFAVVAKGLANDPKRLQYLRKTLRNRVETTLMNAPKFTAEFETALRTLWQRWCES